MIQQDDDAVYEAHRALRMQGVANILEWRFRARMALDEGRYETAINIINHIIRESKRFLP